jgi:hypothetical protein
MTEVRNLPEEKISFKQHTFEKFLGKYTGIGSTEHPEAINSIRLDLTRNLGKLLGDLQDEVSFCFDKEIGPCQDYKQITVYPTVVQIVAGLSARAFVGLPLCRDKEWTDATMAFTKDAIILMHMNSMIPFALRPYLSPLLPPFRKLAGYRNFAGNKLKPQVESILNTYKEKLRGFKTMSEDEAMAEAEKSNFNMVHWMIGHFKDPERVDPFELGQQQMTAAFAAIHTTGMAASHAIFDLAAYPEYIPILRKEIEDVIEEEAFPDKRLRKTSMAKLRKLDSFIKESARMSPPTLGAFCFICNFLFVVVVSYFLRQIGLVNLLTIKRSGNESHRHSSQWHRSLHRPPSPAPHRCWFWPSFLPHLYRPRETHPPVSISASSH